MSAPVPSASGKPQSFRRSIAWATAGQAAYFVLQFAGSVIVARLLNPFETGVFVAAMALIGVIGILQSLGLSSYLVRERVLDDSILATAFTINGAIACVLALLIAGFGLVSEHMFAASGIRQIFFWLAAMPLIGALGFLPITMLEREGNFRIGALIRIISTFAGTTATVLFAYAGHSFMSLAYGQVIGASVSTIVVSLAAPHHVRFRVGLTRWRQVGTFGLHMLLIAGMNRAALRLSDLILGRVLGLGALGLYARSSSINAMLWDSVHMAIGRVVFVDLSKAAEEEGLLRVRYLRVLEIMTALLWPAFAGLAVLAGPFIGTVYGAKWLPATMPLTMLCVASILQVSVTMTWELLVVGGETGRQARLETLRSVVSVLLFAAGCSISLTAAAASRILDAMFAILLYRPHIARITGSHAGDFTSIYLRSLILTGAAAGPSTALMLARNWSPATPIWQLAGSIAVGVSAWVLALRLLRHPLYEEAERLFRRQRAVPA
jgi:O-antigen/teichoic acid export membrane protein